MSSAFEIILIESMVIYGSYNVSQKDAVNDFVKYCKKYGDVEYSKYNPYMLMPTSSTVSYSINNGDDKPMMIMLVGNITIDICKEIDENLKVLFRKGL
jgi:hypothetical protein